MIYTNNSKNSNRILDYNPQNSFQEAYRYNRHLDYSSFFSNTNSAKLKFLPSILSYVRVYDPKRNNAYTMTNEMAQVFMQESQNPTKKPEIEDFAQNEIGMSEDKINLILGEIKSRERLRNDNLDSLYGDLFKIYNWRNCRTFPMDMATDNVWLDMNKMELDIRDKIRRELKDSVRDTSFPEKDLRESLLEYKTKNQESQMLEGGLEMELGFDKDPIPTNLTGDKTGAYKKT